MFDILTEKLGGVPAIEGSGLSISADVSQAIQAEGLDHLIDMTIDLEDMLGQMLTAAGPKGLSMGDETSIHLQNLGLSFQGLPQLEDFSSTFIFI